jgi:hypothetical protein
MVLNSAVLREGNRKKRGSKIGEEKKRNNSTTKDK